MKTKAQRKKYFQRIVAIYMALSLFFQVTAPTVAMALTTGPSQPEVQSFEPVEANTMVNTFSGDFTYNIPLLTVPGPNGGYPINLSYHSGITMEQEASWVGLGWNINPGVISRNVRGIPDDFDGELITKEINQKTNRTFSLGGGFGTELFGLEKAPGAGGSLGAVLNYDNYKGLSLAFNANLATPMFSLDANFDPETGIGLNPTLTFGSKIGSASLGATYSSRNGLMGVGLSLSSRTKEQINNAFSQPPDEEGFKKSAPSTGSGTRFGTASNVPHQNLKYGGIEFHMRVTLGTENAGSHGGIYGELGYKQRKLKTPTIKSKAYGYLNYQNLSGTESLFDYNKDNNGPVAYNAPALEIPVATYDIFQATGQGIAGVFRPYRSDLGVFYDPSIKSNYDDVNLGLEFGVRPSTTVPAIHLGNNLGLTFSSSYSGKWQSMDDQLLGSTPYMQFVASSSNLDGSGNAIVNSAHPNVYFKNAAELTTNSYSDNELGRMQGTTPLAFDFTMAVSKMVALEPKVQNNAWGSGSDIFTYVNRKDYERRSTNFHYRTYGEVTKDITAQIPTQVYDLANQADYNIYSSTILPNAKSNHIAEVSVYKEDGMKYVYGLPVYNNSQEEVFFNLTGGTQAVSSTKYKRWANYSGSPDNVNNNCGVDNFYSSTSTPAYAHSYMLTAIYSPDYVDLTGDGPTDDDFGYYVKFSYTRVAGYQWRTPMFGANWDKGFYSTDGDDKGSYMYGTKDIHYLTKVETKSHKAEFTLADREDSYGAATRANLNSSTTPTNQWQDQTVDLKKLSKIELRSKSNNELIKTVEFTYGYTLCKGVINHEDANFTSANAGTGKLTLEKVTFTYQGNNKGILTPYEFTYTDGGTYDNPDYDPSSVNRWGDYKPDGANSGPLNEYFPYVDQSDANNSGYAAAWNLKKISLPSGATITVNYEADDYAYVQDKRAMQMYIVTKTGNSTTNGSGTNSLKSGSDIFDRLYFNLPVAAANQAELNDLVAGVDKLYFKAYVNLKNFPAGGAMAKDYVEGYCNINRDGTDPVVAVGSFPTSQAYLKVRFVSTSKTDNTNGKLHPFRKAAFEYMKLQRPDLFYPNAFLTPGSTVGLQFVSSIINFFTSIQELFTGYYDACRINGYAGSLELGLDPKSFIRMNDINYKKQGGGHRVSKITIADNWDLMNTGGGEKGYTYGQEYKYLLPDGKSSGVAEYEPLIGGDEIPHHQPSDRFSAESKLINRQKEFYAEEPYGEALFPGANVGYSRVIVRNIDPPDPYNSQTPITTLAETSKSGVSVHEFYTAKDFPVRVTYTDVHSNKNNFSISIPYIGSKSSSSAGHSQGFTIELNDMHGKPKSDATYNSKYYNDLTHVGTNPNPNPPCVSKAEYVYNTVSAYNPNMPNYLKSTVPVLEASGTPVNKDMGVTYDFYTMMNENSSFSFHAGQNFNLDVEPPIPVPSGLPTIQLGEVETRTISTTKVIMRNGILMQTRMYDNGSVVINKNLAFDASSGAPVLTTTINEFDKPVYTYDYRAHWYYTGMKNNGDRYRFTASSLTLSGTSGSISVGYSGGGTIVYSSIFKAGDLLYFNNAAGDAFYTRVTSVSSSAMTVLPESGTISGSSGSWTATIVKPIESNQQAISCGYLTSLKDPTDPYTTRAPLWSSLNTAITSTPFTSNSISYTYTDSCNANFEGTPTIYNTGNVTIVSANQISMAFYRPPSGQACTTTVSTTSMPFTSSGGTVYDINNYRFYYVSNTQVKVVNINNNASELATVQLCLGWEEVPTCFDDVIIRASATTFTNNLGALTDWTDIGDPGTVLTRTTTSPQSTVAISTNSASNGYKFGQLGVWKAQNTFTWLSARQQASPQTNIATDGTVVRWKPYPWGIPAGTADKKWNMVNKVTLFNPYGFESENKDVLDNYTSALYGYKNQLATSVAANAGYYEQAFDGFEDYSAASVASTKTGHFNFAVAGGGSNVTISSTQAHTGKKSMEIGTSAQVTYTGISDNASTSTKGLSYGLNLISGKKYVLTFWVKNINSNNFSGYVTVANSSSSDPPTSSISTYQIEGWRRVEVNFKADGGTAIDINIGSGTVTSYVDDIRLQPLNSSQKTYVYDPAKLWLVAELDERDFATFYNYDEEGSLVQVKKETTNGIVTIKAARQNTRNP